MSLAKDMKWVRLKKGDDWGHVYYCLEPLTPAGFADFKRGIRFRDWEKIKIKDDRGIVHDARVELEEKTVSISDMGHEYGTEVCFPSFRVDSADGFFHRNFEPDEVDVLEDWVKSKPTNSDPDRTEAADYDNVEAVKREVRDLPSLAEYAFREGWQAYGRLLSQKS
jgi:hypothetical protein